MTYDPTFLSVDPRDDAAGYTVEGFHTAADPAAAPRGAARFEEITAAVLAGTDPTAPAVIDERVHAILDPRTRGESVTYTRPAPTPFTATVSTRKVRRGKKGTSTTITGPRGKVWVVGDSSQGRTIGDAARIPAVVVQHAIDELRRGNRYGHVDGDALAALTTRLYDVPDLIGTDHWSWSAATVEIPSSGAAVLAAQTCVITAGISPRVDSFTMPRGEHRKPRNVRTMPPRRRVTMPRRRTADPTPREHVVRGVWTWEHVIELPAGADDAAHMFHGFRKVRRGDTAHSRRRTAQPARDSFVIDETADVIDAVTSLAAIVRDDGKGKYGFRTADGTYVGTISVDARARFSVTGIGEPVRQCRTVDALRAKLAANI